MIIKRDFLDIDLTLSEVRVKKIEQKILDDFIAGPPLALRLYFDYITESDNISGERSIAVFTTGLFSSLDLPGLNTLFSVFPTSSNNIDEVQVSGGFSECFRALMWNGFSITGRAENPSVIVFKENSVLIKDMPKELSFEEMPSFFHELIGSDFESLIVPENVREGNTSSVLIGKNKDNEYLTDSQGLTGFLAAKNISAMIISKKSCEFKTCSAGLEETFSTPEILNKIMTFFPEKGNMERASISNELFYIYDECMVDGDSTCSTCPMKCYSSYSHQYFEKMSLPLVNDWLAILDIEKSPVNALKLWNKLVEKGLSPYIFSSIYSFLKKTVSDGYDCFDEKQLSVDSLIESLSQNKGEFRALTEGIYISAKKYHSFGRNAAELVRNFEVPSGFKLKASSFLTLLSLTGVSRPRFPNSLWLLFTKLFSPSFELDGSTLLYTVKNCISYIEYNTVLETLGFCQHLRAGISEKKIKAILDEIGLDFNLFQINSAAKRGYFLKRLINYRLKKFSFESSSWSFFIKPCYMEDKNIFHDYQRIIFTFYAEMGLDEFGYPKSDILKELNMENLIWI